MPLDVHRSHRAFLAVALGVFVLLVLATAIAPALEMRRRYPPPAKPVDDLVARGFEVYRSYGCQTCHTQQIRGDERRTVLREGGEGVPVLQADRRFGLEEPSRAEEYAGWDPPLLGTQRTGPDLMGVGDRLPDPHWHYWHLYDPQVVSPGSIMPGLPWLFYAARRPRTADPGRAPDEEVAALDALGLPDGHRLYATADARALVEYLLSLRRAKP